MPEIYRLVFIVSYTFAMLVIPLSAWSFYNYEPAEKVFGQPGFNSSGTAWDPNYFYGPTGLSMGWDPATPHNPVLLISDSFNNRVFLYWNLGGVEAAPLPNVVYGQPDWWTNRREPTPAASSITFYKPGGTCATLDGKMIVADSLNNRILIFNLISTAGRPADVVVGQVDMNANLENQGGPSSNPAANTLNWPTSVATDGTHLFVADASNHRVLIYNTIPNTHNASADIVIGHPDFTARYQNLPTLQANTLFEPHAVYCSGGRLFIADSFNNRVLIYNSIPTTNFASADLVIGQPDFQSNSINARPDHMPNALGLNVPCGIWLDHGRLFIADQCNSRVLIYNQIPAQNYAAADIVLGQMDMNSSILTAPADNRTLSYPAGLLVSGDYLYVADWQHNRVLAFRDATPPPTPTITPVVSPTPSPTLTQTQTATPPPEKFTGGYALPCSFMPALGKITEFKFELHDPASLFSIKIFNLRGQLQRTLTDTRQWDGRNESGHLCEGGVYVYQIEAENERASGKVVLIK